METESPWPVDPTPVDMAYVAVCSDCHGMAFVCNVDSASDHRRTLTECFKRGHALHRVPSDSVRNPLWHFCRCQRKKVPHAS